MDATQVAATPNALVDISEVSPMSDADQELFGELHEVLKKHNALRRFGITLLHQHFEISPDEVLLETTDRQSRTQTIRPVLKAGIHDLEYIETSWRLDTGKPLMACICVNDPDIGHSHQSRG